MIELSSRLERLSQRLHDVDYHMANPWYFEDVNILDIPENFGLREEPIPVRKAYALRYVAEHLPVEILDDELIVGRPNQNSVEFGLCIPKYLTEEERKFCEKLGVSEISLEGHHPPAWEKILEYGTSGLKEQVEKKLTTLFSEKMLDKEKINEYRGMLLSLDALEIHAARYRDKALSLAMELPYEDLRRNELLGIYEILNHVPRFPARTLHEAVQSLWLTYTVLNSGGEFLPLGRLDQYFYKYFINDIETRRLNIEQATDVIGSFLIKCNEKIVLDSKKMKDHFDIGAMASGTGFFTTKTLEETRLGFREHYWHVDEPEESEHNKFFGQEANNRMMTCVVGGLNLDGSDATNEVSYLIIELINKMKLLMPTVGARIHKNTPDSFLRLVASVLSCRGQGEPVIYNDDAILKGYKQLGIPLEDARTYSSDGCWETLLPGKTNFAYSIVFLLQCVEWAMNRGVSVKSKKRDSVTTKDVADFTDFEDFYEAFKIHFYLKMDEIADYFVSNLGIVSLIAPDPLFSAMADDCIDKGDDFYGHGARYQIRMLLLSGLADAVDSLMVIKKVVFEKKKVTLSELNEALHANWEGYERLRAYAMNKVEKFGNDCDEPDEMVKRVLSDFTEKLHEIRGKYKEIYWTGGIGTFHMYALWGNMTHASANGRKACEPLAPNYSPVPGFDKKGPLAVIRSVTKPDLTEFLTGTPVDLSIQANEFEGEEGIQRLTDMIRGFCDLGGQILTVTSSSVEELRDAKLHPERHQSLRVRMGGLSAYFVQLAPVAQDKIIARFSKS